MKEIRRDERGARRFPPRDLHTTLAQLHAHEFGARQQGHHLLHQVPLPAPDIEKPRLSAPGFHEPARRDLIAHLLPRIMRGGLVIAPPMGVPVIVFRVIRFSHNQAGASGKVAISRRL